MNRKRNIVMLTGTITPAAAGRAVTRRADPDIRRLDYENALRFYLSRNSAVDEILFCENSQSDLESLRQIAKHENPMGRPVTFHSSQSDCPVEYGKGHSELQMMDRAYHDHLENADPDTRIWKITGRLQIANIERLIKTAPDAWNLYMDFRLVPNALRAFGTDRWADTRIIGFTPEGYRRYFLDRRAVVGTPGHQQVVELALFSELYDAWKAGDPIVPRFRVQPVIVGVGAVSLKDYNDLPSRAKNMMRSVTRRVAPGLWL